MSGDEWIGGNEPIRLINCTSFKILIENYRWTTKADNFKNWYLRADFGSWNVLLADLSKSIRVFMEDNEKRKTCSELFPSNEFLTLIRNSKVFNILEDVRKLHATQLY